MADINKELLHEVIKMLEQFDVTTRHLSADSKPTLHLVVPVKYQLQRSMSPAADDNEIISHLKEHLLLKIDEYFTILLLHCCAVTLGPRLKNNMNIMAKFDRESAIKSLKQMVQSEAIVTTSPSITATTASNV